MKALVVLVLIAGCAAPEAPEPDTPQIDALEADLRDAEAERDALRDDLDEARAEIERLAGEMGRAAPEDVPSAPEPAQEVAPTYLPPDPATARVAARDLLLDIGRRAADIDDSELDALVDAYMHIHEEAWHEGGDAWARFLEHFYEQYGGEITTREAGP